MIIRILRLGISPRDKFLYIVAIVCAVLVAIVIHELAHAVTAYLNGDNTAKEQGRITLNPIKHFNLSGFIFMLLAGFGWAKPVMINENNFKRRKLGIFTTSISGVVANFITALFFAFLMFITQIIIKKYGVANNEFAEILYTFFVLFFTFSIILNISLMAFNILPIYPLDGFNVLRSVLKPENKILIFLYKYGIWILLGLVVLGPLLGRIHPYLDFLEVYITSILNLVKRMFSQIFSSGIVI